jgi:hypothetical protein
MELVLEDIKSTLIRLQGQVDVWQNLYQAEEARLKAETKNVDTVPKA